MPTLALALYLSVAEQPGHDPVQVVRLDTHLLRDLRNRDAGLAAHELQRLVGTCTTAAATTRATWAAARAAAGGCRRRRGACSTRATRATAGPDERGARRLELRDFVLEFAESVVYFLHGAVDKSSQMPLPPRDER